MVSKRATAVLCDFGLAKALEEIPSPLVTADNPPKGTANYMSPELLAQEGVHTLQSDIWAWGCVLMEVSRPFPSISTGSTYFVLLDHMQ